MDNYSSRPAEDPRHETIPFVYSHHLDIIGRADIPTIVSPQYQAYRRHWEEYPLTRTVADFPLHLDIEVTGYCNLMCQHCVRYSRRTEIGNMDLQVFTRIIDEGQLHGLCSVAPAWLGESFLHPDLIDMIGYAKAHGVLDVRINTNGTMVDRRMAERLLESGLDRIIFSLDAAAEATYNVLKVGSSFQEVRKNIEHLIDLKKARGSTRPQVIVQMIDQRQSHDELMTFVYYWKGRGADRIRIATYQSPDGRPDDKNRVQNTSETIFPCPQLWQRLTIAWDGTVYPCLGDNAGREPLGNVMSGSIYDIWHGERLNYLRERHSSFRADDIDACLHCDLNKISPLMSGVNGQRWSDARIHGRL